MLKVKYAALVVGCLHSTCERRDQEDVAEHEVSAEHAVRVFAHAQTRRLAQARLYSTFPVQEKRARRRDHSKRYTREIRWHFPWPSRACGRGQRHAVATFTAARGEKAS